MTESELVQHLSQTHIDYGAPAKLYDMKLQPDMVSARGGETFHGSLAGAVRRFMALQPTEAAFASIGIDDRAITGVPGGFLQARAIWEIAKRHDFPAQ
jgi:hypothetical protein